MLLPLSDLPGLMAVQHNVLKALKKETGLRQRDWEVLCACQRLSLAKYPFTAAKIDAYMQGAYFLPCIYDSVNTLLNKGYIKVVVPGKPFRPELYELTYRGEKLVFNALDEMRHLSERLDQEHVGKISARVW